MIITLPLKTILSALDNVVMCEIDDSFVVNALTSLQAAGPQDLAIILDRGEASVFDPVSLEAINKSAAGVLLAQAPVVDGRKYIIVTDVLVAFTKLANFLEAYQDKQIAPAMIDQTACVHASAVVEAGAVIGAQTVIGAHAFVGRQAIIGNNVKLYPGVKVLDRCIVGDNSIIHAGAVIGSDGFGYQVGKRGMAKIPQIGIVRIGNSVEIGANCMIDRASFDQTVIGDGVKMDNGIHIAHNVTIGASTAILAQTGIAGSAQIGIGCQIGGQVAIKDHIKIGNGVKIVSKSAVMNDLKDGETVAGAPAIPFNQWKRITVSMHKLPEIIKMASKLGVTPAGGAKTLWQRFFG